MSGSASSSSRRRRGLRRRDALHMHSLHFGPNMTPMVDIVMVILIFFMASAAFLGNEWFLKAAIPFEAGRGRSPDKKNDPLALPPTRTDILLDVDAQGRTTVTLGTGLQRASIDEFLAYIERFRADKAAGEIEVVIRPSSKVPYADVVRVHAACDDVGIYKVGIGVARTAGSAPAPSPGPAPKP
ncbi:MAG: biopolymer transporter ExbD [Phycisphaerales bacterium]|nr:biopolymer transporter ExbD [Phycisphaerales bacterium]